MRASENKDEIKALVSGLIQEAHALLSETINATKAADERLKAQASYWTDRHRLHVLLEAAEETLRSLPGIVVAPWFLAELGATLNVVRRWREKLGWQDIEKSLKDAESFAHTIATLHVAEHLERSGHEVYIVPRSEGASPDLMLHAIGGTQDLVLIECYQPSTLCGKPSDLASGQAENIVKKAMEKAKRQLGTRIPGILVICGYNQSHRSIDTLKQATANRLSKTSRRNLCGIWLIMLGVLFSADKEQSSFSPTISADLIPNPSYFGRVSIETTVPEYRDDLIKTPLIDISTDRLVPGDFKPMPLTNIDSVQVKKERTTTPKVVKLNVIGKPDPLSRSVVHGTGNKVPPLFIGKGNIDHSCGQCGAILAKRVWEPSISNIVLECPGCHSYNEFPTLPYADYDRIQLTRGNYHFSDAVKLRTGVCLEGS